MKTEITFSSAAASWMQSALQCRHFFNNSHARKHDTYYVSKVFPIFTAADLRHDLMYHARNMTKVRTQNHPWRDMTDEFVLISM